MNNENHTYLGDGVYAELNVDRGIREIILRTGSHRDSECY